MALYYPQEALVPRGGSPPEDWDIVLYSHSTFQEYSLYLTFPDEFMYELVHDFNKAVRQLFRDSPNLLLLFGRHSQYKIGFNRPQDFSDSSPRILLQVLSLYGTSSTSHNAETLALSTQFIEEVCDPSLGNFALEKAIQYREFFIEEIFKTAKACCEEKSQTTEGLVEQEQLDPDIILFDEL